MKNNNLPQLVKDTCQKYGINPDDSLWNCHGTWVMYHRALERVAALHNITFNEPTIIEHNADKRICVMLVKGTWQGKEEWTIGEAMPINIDRKNNQQQYPFAMAEKRAKDRVILKLLGLHGYVYSQEEFADAENDLQKNKPQPKPIPDPKPEPNKTTELGEIQQKAKLTLDETIKKTEQDRKDIADGKYTPATETKSQVDWEKIHQNYMKNISQLPSQSMCQFWFNKHKETLKEMKTAVPRMYGEIEAHYTSQLESYQL